MKYKAIIILLSLIALFTGCDDEKERIISLPELNLKAEAALPEKGDALYASWLYLAPGLEQVYDNALFKEDIIELTFANPGEGTRVGLEMQECTIAHESYAEKISGTEDTIRWRFPVIWKLETLRKWKQETPVELSWKITLDEQEIGTYRKEFSCHPAEECVVKINPSLDIKAMYVGYIEEDNPILESLISEAVDLGIVYMFCDYQRGTEYVKQQLFTIWSLLEKRGIKTRTHGNNEGITQTITPINQVLKNKGGSEEDVALLFTALCQKIGFCTTLEPRPNGVYIGIADNFYSLQPERIYFLDMSKLSGSLEKSSEDFEAALSAGDLLHEEDSEAPSTHEEIWIDAVRLYVPSLSLSQE